MNGSLKMVKTLVLLIFVGLLFSSCGGQVGLESSTASGTTTPTPTPDPTPAETLPSVPAVYDSTNDFFVTLDTNTTYPFYTSQLNAPGTHCKVASGTAGIHDMYCVIDAPEFGYYFGGLNLVYNIPAGMCEYSRVTPYWYYNSEVGVGPTQIGIEKTTTSTGQTSFRCEVNSSGLGSCGTSFLEAYFASVDGQMTEKCMYDTSDNGGANCCMGAYTFESTDITLDASGVPTVTYTSVPGKKWGGDIKKCTGGQGRTNWKYFNKQGYPVPEALETRLGLQLESYVVTPPIISLLSAPTNIPVANYFTTAAIDPITAVDEHEHTGFDTASATTSINPYYVTPISDRSGDLVSTGSPYYEFACLDDAFEIKNRIRLLVREWDTTSAYTNYVATETVSGAKPWHVVPGFANGGLEATDCDGLTPERCNDFLDADNFVFDQSSNVYLTAPANNVDRYKYFPANEF